MINGKFTEISKMDKYEVILKFLNKHIFRNQRELARETGFSVGAVNSILKKMTEEGYLEKADKSFTITNKGSEYLEEKRKISQTDKLHMEGGQSTIRTAVILAAGENHAFSCPTGLLKVHGVRIIDYILRFIRQAGIEKIYIVVGAMQEQYRSYLRNKNVEILENPHYKWSGTMASLYAVRDKVQEDFLLVESNLIFEESVIPRILAEPYGNCVLLAAPSGSGDEAYVELNKDRTIMRIAKDIRQLNHIDGEMLGVSKISFALYEKMLEYYEDNTNPLLNYEYVIENIGRLYNIYGMLGNDLVWMLIEDEAMLKKAEDIIYPKIKKRSDKAKENHARKILQQCMGLTEDSIQKLQVGGGMTNTNYFATVDGKEYILRIPGACTDEMINRKSEQHNAALASTLGINPQTVYFNTDTGIKITECIRNANTLNGKTAKLESSIKKTTAILKKLHQSDVRLYGSFSVQIEYEKYKSLIAKSNGEYYPGFAQMDEFFYKVQNRLSEIGLECLPCHNDLVAENFIEDDEGRMYLIDWEYAGYHDPAWDLASHLIECEFSPLEEELFLQYYAPEGISRKCQEKILLFKISQDILWSAWTVLKEANGEDFGGYGIGRLKRAAQMKEEYEDYYGKI